MSTTAPDPWNEGLRLGAPLVVLAGVRRAFRPGDPDRRVCACSAGGDDVCRQEAPGLHPLRPSWRNTATASPVRLAEQRAAHPSANLGVLTGRRSGLVVIETTGAKGEFALSDISEMPLTAEAAGGELSWRWFRRSGRTLTGDLAPGVRLLGDGEFAPLPGCRLVDGSAIRWRRSPDDAGFDSFPAQLLPDRSTRQLNSSELDAIYRFKTRR